VPPCLVPLAVVWGFALLAATGLGNATAAMGAPVTIAPLHGETAVEAYGDVTVWSDYDATSRSWHVVVRSSGHIWTPSIPSAPTVIEVDVGPSSSGVPTLTYVNCVGTCHVVIAKLDGGDPHTVPGSQRASHPTIWGDRVAWVSAARTVMISRWDGRGRRVLGGAPRRKCYHPNFESQRRPVCEATFGTGVEALQLYRGQLALIDTFWIRGEVGGTGPPTEVRVEGIAGGPQQLVALMVPGDGESWVGPSWWGGKLYFFKNGPGPAFREGPYPFVYRFDPRRNRYARARSDSDLTGFSMLDGQHAFEATTPDTVGRPACSEGGVVTCVVRLSEPFTFRPTTTAVDSL
jgi:hypothetical protein